MSIKSIKGKESQGFTILELLVVFSVIGVLAGVGFAAFTNYSRSQVLDQAVQDLKSAVDNSRFNAVSSVKPSMCTSANKTLNSYQIVFTPANNTYVVNAICESTTVLISTKVLPSSITMVSTGNPPITTCSILSYNTLSGYESGTGCVVVLSAYGRTKSVVIDGGGNASIQ